MAEPGSSEKEPERTQSEELSGPRKAALDYGRNVLLENHPYIAGYLFIAAILYFVLRTDLKVFGLTFLFLYLISDVITNDLRRALKLRAVPKFVFFSILYVLIIVGLVMFSWKVIPSMAKSIPLHLRNIQAAVIINFDDLNARYGLDQYIASAKVQEQVITLFTGAAGVISVAFGYFYKFVLFFIFALFVNLFLYHRTEKVREVFGRRPESLMGFLFEFTLARVRTFYSLFKRVMGGQLAISFVNTMISIPVILILDLPFPAALILIVFFFGLFPVVGNIVSNTILTLVALSAVGIWAAVVCLCLLVGIHKLEYFLNSKIIGEIVQLPMFVTLTSLVVFELILGIPGLILAIPITLFIRHELEGIRGLPSKG